ncbi:MAG: histidine kinase [Chloroflexi bacterium]|nr:histidine kinase [Chloroflexota bacterium]
MNELERRVAELEAEIAQIKRQLPRHSTPPSLILQLEDLEEELAEARRKLEEQKI